MSVVARFDGEFARVEQDNSVSSALVVVAVGFVVLLAVGALLRANAHLYAVGIPGLMLLAGYLVERPLWGKQIVEIDRETLTVRRGTPRTTRQARVSSFKCVRLLQFRMPKRQVHYAIRIVTDRGMIQVATYADRQWAESLSHELANWLSVPVVNEEGRAFLGIAAEQQLCR